MKKLITTDGTKYAQNLKAFAIIDEKQTDGKPIMIDANVLEEAFENASEADKAAFENVIHFDVEGEEITITPTTSKQTKTPSKGHNAITKVTVNAVTSAIDENIVAGNIKKDVTILGVTGTHEGSEPTLHQWDGTGKYTKLYFPSNIQSIEITNDIATILAYLQDESIIQINPKVIITTTDLHGSLYFGYEMDSDSLAFHVCTPASDQDHDIYDISMMQITYEYEGASTTYEYDTTKTGYNVPLNTLYNESGFVYDPHNDIASIAGILLNYIFVDEADKIADPLS